jgi:hypothetical protein
VADVPSGLSLTPPEERKTDLTAPWSKVLLDKLTVAQLLKNFTSEPSGSQEHDNGSTRTQMNPVYTLQNHLFKILLNVILRQHLGLQSGLSRPDLHVYVFSLPSMLHVLPNTFNYAHARLSAYPFLLHGEQTASSGTVLGRYWDRMSGGAPIFLTGAFRSFPQRLRPHVSTGP